MESMTTEGLFPEDKDHQASRGKPGKSFQGRKVQVMNFNWLQQSREQRLRQAELQRVLNKRSVASKNMKEDSEQKIMAKKLLNSTFDMEDAPLDYSQSHLSVLNTNIAQAGAKIITDRLNSQSVPPAESYYHDESITIEDLTESERKQSRNKTESQQLADLMTSTINEMASQRKLSSHRGTGLMNLQESSTSFGELPFTSSR